MTPRLPAEIHQLDATAREFDELMKKVLEQAKELSAENAEIERLQQIASTARLSSTSFIIEAGSAFLREDRDAIGRPLKRALQ